MGFPGNYQLQINKTVIALENILKSGNIGPKSKNHDFFLTNVFKYVFRLPKRTVPFKKKIHTAWIFFYIISLENICCGAHGEFLD